MPDSARVPGPSDPASLDARFQAALGALALTPARALLAVSGGPDSLALLRLAAGNPSGLSFVVGHVDHGISPVSGQVAQLVESASRAAGFPFVSEQLGLGPGASETSARQARWQALGRLRTAAGAEWIVTGHQLDDQAETVLMRVLRGSGPAGLAGMSARDGRILRPLLSFRREELAQYVRRHQLDCWLDPANEDSRHDRVWLRRELLPRLAERWPAVTGDLVRAARDAGRWRAAWEQVIELLPGLDVQAEPKAISVAAGVLADYDSEMGAAVVRTLARRLGVVLGEAAAERVLGLVRGAASGRWVPLGGQWRAASAFGRLRLEQGPEPLGAAVLDPEAGTVSWGAWQLWVARDTAPPNQERRSQNAWFPVAAMTVRSPHFGDRMQPLGGLGHRSVARLLQEARVPQGRRSEWPVVELAGQPVWLPGVCRSQASLPEPGTEAVKIDAVHR